MSPFMVGLHFPPFFFVTHPNKKPRLDMSYFSTCLRVLLALHYRIFYACNEWRKHVLHVFNAK